MGDEEKHRQEEIVYTGAHPAPLVLTWPIVRHYIATRLSTLVPPRNHTWKEVNPFPSLALLTKQQWLFFFVALCGWTWDAFDFFSVSVTASLIAESLEVSVADITWGITLVLMLRSVGSIIFGVAADKWGRKWPFIINCAIFIVLELGTGFVQTYKQFLGVRALFGIAMGGIYGNCAATALEDCPVEARGFISGCLQQGYAFGYLLVVIFNRAITYNNPHSWRALFWFGSGPPVLIIVFRLMLPETNSYRAHKRAEKAAVYNVFVEQAKSSLKAYWLMLIYLVVLMAGFNFLSHGSQDLYPTMLTKQLHFSTNANTVTMCVANLGAMAGGILIGHFSTFIGRRLSIIICCILGGAMIYPWGFVRNTGINAAVFFMQFFVQGAWGIIPIHLSELSPPAFRAFIVGTAYQLGNLASSASSTIEAQIGERFPIEGEVAGTYNYGKVMAIFIGAVYAFVLVVTLVGPERRAANLQGAHVDEILNQQDEIEKYNVEHNENIVPTRSEVIDSEAQVRRE